MKKLFIYLTGLLLSPFIMSCGDDKEENEYAGVNKVYLLAENPVIEEVGSEPLTVTVELTTALKQDIKLNVELQDDENGVLRLEGNPVTIKAGEKKATLNVFSNRKNLLAVDTYISLGISAFPVTNMALNEVLKIRVKPNPSLSVLTDKQLALIKGYKEKYGIDLTEWLGMLSCHTVVNSPAEGYLTPFVKTFTKEFDGKTVVTLSEESTPDTPVLKMIDNPMGLTEYLYWVFRMETVEDTEFWTQQVSPQKLMAQIGWNKDSKESFSVTLDGIKLKNITVDKAELDYIGQGENSYKEPIQIVPFAYEFSAWKRQQELIKTDEVAKETYEQGGVADPDFYLCNMGIEQDYWEDKENFIQTVGNIDFKSKKMSYKFLIDHTNAGGYTQVTVTYEKN